MPNFPTEGGPATTFYTGGNKSDFKRNESQESINAQPTAVQAPKDPSSQLAEGQAKIGGQLQEIGLNFAKASDSQKATEAQLGFKTGMNDILSRAENDPNLDNQADYMNEIAQLNETSSNKKFIFGASRNETNLKLGYEASVGTVQVQNLYRKKLEDKGRVDSLITLDNMASEGGPDLEKRMSEFMATKVNAGFFDREGAYKIVKDYLEKGNKIHGQDQINKDLYSAETPEEVDLVTQAITSGNYEKDGVTIDPEKKYALIKLAKSTKKNIEISIKAQEVEATAKNRVDTISGVASGKIKFESINIADVSEYDPKLGEALTKIKDFMTNYNPKIPLKEQRVSMIGVLTPNEVIKARDYARSVDDVFMRNDNERLGEFILRELEKKGDGNTQSVKLAAFMQLAALKRMANNPQTVEDNDAAKRLEAIQAGVAYLKAINPYLSATSIGEFITRNFLSGATDKKTVMEEARGIADSKIIQRYPSVTKLPSMPNKIVDGDASVEDLQSGLNELKNGASSADYPRKD